jgi:hypothetical protein
MARSMVTVNPIRSTGGIVGTVGHIPVCPTEEELFLADITSEFDVTLINDSLVTNGLQRDVVSSRHGIRECWFAWANN